MKRKIMPFYILTLLGASSGSIYTFGESYFDNLPSKILLLFVVLLSIVVNLLLKIRNDKNTNEIIHQLRQKIDEQGRELNVLQTNSMPSRRNIKNVEQLIINVLDNVIGWSLISNTMHVASYTYSGGYMRGYILKNENRIQQIFWLHSEEINTLLEVPKEKFTECLVKIYNKTEIDRNNNLKTAWNSLAEAFMPVLAFAFDMNGPLKYDSDNKCISIAISEVNSNEKYSSDLNILNVDGTDYIMLNLTSNVLGQLIGKNRIDISQIILNYVYDSKLLKYKSDFI